MSSVARLVIAPVDALVGVFAAAWDRVVVHGRLVVGVCAALWLVVAVLAVMGA
jgi:hypothetical protein